MNQHSNYVFYHHTQPYHLLFFCLSCLNSGIIPAIIHLYVHAQRAQEPTKMLLQQESHRQPSKLNVFVVLYFTRGKTSQHLGKDVFKNINLYMNFLNTHGLILNNSMVDIFTLHYFTFLIFFLSDSSLILSYLQYLSKRPVFTCQTVSYLLYKICNDSIANFNYQIYRSDLEKKNQDFGPNLWSHFIVRSNSRYKP